MRCPCLSGNPYAECCGRFHRREAAAPTAEALMRSRYAAFAVGDAAYLLATWHPRTQPETFALDDELRWTRLEIERTVAGGPFDTEGVVEFTAYCRDRGTPSTQHEVSRFVKIDRRWVYLDAV
ncbi:hypothetical protein E3T26_05130 [Cryobacterium sp. TMT1-21]|uniref:YchJ-like middle NTF2-like domain-containing protein n=1 Tax=Cryobacterium shii TaxID=1259235 RepID=A0AAQ2C3V9_9MICO|nr:YchJ family protein [Cryobacterium sp. TMT2-23]TFC42301.1 hypothetical protein E3O49_14725 [Cryobacterium shii]TFC86033.1 hypothetical protein E3T24_07165 [Cryobacterium sp. TmT2-59]TFD13781.1 hypothetical protein E3T42_13670 [Cryobacterium sp. TMT4-10]TFD16084.1 hypothetical protein E3T26_05130 [Cryobacterium sp. TMT1-21]TFD39884.1 hypothetical protein E3T37_07295 [Cryobacterium sp. TMT2-10]